MAFDLTQKPFENLVHNSFEERAQKLSTKAVKTRKDTWLEWETAHGNLHCVFKPTGRVKISWRDRGGIKEGWYVKDWTIATTLRKSYELLHS